MPDYTTLIPSPYLSAGDLPPQGATFRILKVEPIVMKGREGKGDPKGLITLDGTKPLIANKTNLRRMAQLYGRDYNGWIGQFVPLYAEMVDGPNGVGPAIRVRIQAAPIPAPPEPASAGKKSRKVR